MGLFGKKKAPDPREQVKEWNKKLRRERNNLERQMSQIKRSEQQAVTSIKQAAKRNDNTSVNILAKEVVGARKAVTRITTAKANIASVETQLTLQVPIIHTLLFDSIYVIGFYFQAAQLRVVGSLQQSTEVMQSMQLLVNVPEVHRTMQELSREMMKAGIMEELVEETLDAMEEAPLDADNDAEVEKVILEITHNSGNKKLTTTAVPEASIDLPELPVERIEDGEEEAAATIPDVKNEVEDMCNRLEELRTS